MKVRASEVGPENSITLKKECKIGSGSTILPGVTVGEMQLRAPGLKVINIHPMHFMLNTPYFSYTREIKDSLSREEWNNLNEERIEKLAFKGEGITTYIKKMVELINREKIKTMFLDDVYEWIIK